MPISIVVQNVPYEVSKHVAMLSTIIKKKIINLEESIILEDMSHESFGKFVSLGELYYKMNDKEKSAYIKNPQILNDYTLAMDDIYNELTKEQIFSLVIISEKLNVKFLMHYLSNKLSKYVMDDKFFDAV